MKEQEINVSKFDVEELTDKILVYSQTQSNISLHPYQQEFARAIIQSVITHNGDEITALFSRQSGKSETVAVVSQGLMVILPILAKMFPDELGMYKEGIWIGLFAPSKEQCFTTFSRTRDRLQSKHAKLVLADPEIDVGFENIRGNPMVLTNGSKLQYHSAAIQANIESKTYHLIILDEAQDIDAMKARKSIRPMLASINGTLVQIGTCNTRMSDFYHAIRRNVREENEGAPKSHFQYDDRVVSKYNKYYKTFVAKEAYRLGTDSDEFRLSYRLQWIFERGMFTTQEHLEEIMPKDLRHALQDKSSFCVAGIDVGKNDDSTVVTVASVDWKDVDEFGRPLVTILNWLEITGDDHESQFYQIVDFLDNYNIKSIYIDATGMGDAIADRFMYRYHGTADVTPYKFSRSSKSDMWKNADGYIRGKRLIIPNHAKTRKLKAYKKFYAQLLDLEKDYHGQYMVCQHPNVKGARDDFADSLGLCLLAAKSETLPEIEVQENIFFN